MKQQTIKQPKSWTKVESANFIRFENIGDTVEGLLTEKNQGDKMNFYKIRTFDNEEKKFHGTNQLDDLLSNIIPPCYFKFTLTGSQDTANGTMKIFEVCKGEN